MAKAIITIEDVEDGEGVHVELVFDPDPVVGDDLTLDLTAAQELGFDMYESYLRGGGSEWEGGLDDDMIYLEEDLDDEDSGPSTLN